MKYVYANVIFILTIFISNVAYAVQLPGPLVETKWLADNIDKVVILDVRNDIKSFEAKPVFYKDKKTGKSKLIKVGGHIPGANLINYKNVRTKRKIDGREVTRMIPEKAVFEKLMQEAGVNQDSAVVIVSKGHNSGDATIATRFYWQMKYFGHDNMAILNGGVAQWITDKRPLSLEPKKVTKGSWKATKERKEIFATSQDVENAIKDANVQLVDNRELYLYLGTHRKSYVYAKGHIPGAKTFPHNLITKPGAPAKFLPNEELKKLNDALNVNTNMSTITYCNSGHLATGGWFIMSELLGNKNVKLYDGSMHEWTMDKNRPVSAMKME